MEKTLSGISSLQLSCLNFIHFVKNWRIGSVDFALLAEKNMLLKSCIIIILELTFTHFLALQATQRDILPEKKARPTRTAASGGIFRKR